QPLPQTTDVATNALSIIGQNCLAAASTNTVGGNVNITAGAGATSNATFTSGSINLGVNAPNSGGTEASVNVQRAGTTMLQFGALVGATTNGAIYGPGVTPSSSNYVLNASSTSTSLNAPSSTLALRVAGNVVGQLTSAGFQLGSTVSFGSG